MYSQAVLPHIPLPRVPLHISLPQVLLRRRLPLISLRMLLPPAEIPVQFNDGLVYTKEEKESLTADGKKSIVYHLRKISEVPEACPGEDMADPAWRGPDVWLEKGSFAVPGNSWAGETSSIYDMEGTLLFSTHGRLIKSVDGNYYLRRGAFSGIIDCRGNWLIREYYGRE